MKTFVRCCVCNTLLTGEKINQRGNKYYCHAHYSKLEDRDENRKQKKLNYKLDKLTTSFTNIIETDFTNWTQIDVTVNGMELTT